MELMFYSVVAHLVLPHGLGLALANPCTNFQDCLVQCSVWLFAASNYALHLALPLDDGWHNNLSFKYFDFNSLFPH